MSELVNYILQVMENYLKGEKLNYPKEEGEKGSLILKLDDEIFGYLFSSKGLKVQAFNLACLLARKITKKKYVKLEIYLVKELENVKNPKEYKIKDGVLVKKGFNYSIVFSNNLKAYEVLSEACEKLGLLADAWCRGEVKVYTFKLEKLGDWSFRSNT
ncbi:hypothetical protein HRbin06_00083 [archaeon HR06]|nr:hypothetical protein HRbin06_00083 [archaeon HR06]